MAKVWWLPFLGDTVYYHTSIGSRGVYPPKTLQQDPPMLLALPSPPFPPSHPSLPSPFPPSLSFRGRNPLISSHPLPFPAPVSRGPWISRPGTFFKSRWLQVKYDAFLGEIWPLYRRIVLGADSLKTASFKTIGPTVWVKKKSPPLWFSEIFSQTVGNF